MDQRERESIVRALDGILRRAKRLETAAARLETRLGDLKIEIEAVSE